MSRRPSKILLHIIVWLIIFEFETVLYWKWEQWGILDLKTAVLYNLSINVIKVIGTYVFILWFLPFLSKKTMANLWKKLLTILFLYVWLVTYRMEINWVTWPLLFDKHPSFDPFALELSLFSFFKMITPLPFLLLINGYFNQLDTKEKISQLEKEKIQTELKFLKAQTNPHFLFNTLNNIYVLARNKSELTAPSLAKLSNLLRFMLYESDQAVILLTKELDLIKNYIELEKLRYSDRLSVDLHIDVKNTMIEVPPFLFLPFVENAFKHGASQSTGEISLSISMIVSSNQLQFHCSNPLIDQTNIDKNGIGISNTQRRLSLLYPDKHQLDISTDNNKFQVSIKIDIDE